MNVSSSGSRLYAYVGPSVLGVLICSYFSVHTRISIQTYDTIQITVPVHCIIVHYCLKNGRGIRLDDVTGVLQFRFVSIYLSIYLFFLSLSHTHTLSVSLYLYLSILSSIHMYIRTRPEAYNQYNCIYIYMYFFGLYVVIFRDIKSVVESCIARKYRVFIK